MTALANARHREHGSLIVGSRLRCPRCKTIQPFLSFFAFTRPEEFADELNVVLKCRARVPNEKNGRVEACRCIFSVGEPLSFEGVSHV